MPRKRIPLRQRLEEAWKSNPWYVQSLYTYRLYTSTDDTWSFQQHPLPERCGQCQQLTGWWDPQLATYHCANCRAYRTRLAVEGDVWVR